MRIIADTSVWSLLLRRYKYVDNQSVEILQDAIRQRTVQMLGIIRQELLSGIKDESNFLRIEEILEGFPDLLSDTSDHVEAAKFSNICRRNGIQGSPIDFLICAQAYRHEFMILTEDKDFEGYSRYIPISLYALD